MSISFILVTYNEIGMIEKCLDSIIAQEYQEFELIIVDGMSNDGTYEYITKFINNYNGKIKIRLLINQKRILAAGWNIGLKVAEAPYVIRIDAHATIPIDFLSKNIYGLKKCDNKVAGIGGKIITKTIENNILTSTINLFYSSKVGVGSSFRTKSKSGYSDTVPFALYEKEIFNIVGYFDENMKRNQDNDFHGRLRSHGYKLYYDTNIYSFYYARQNLGKAIQQMYGNGYWIILNAKKSIKSISGRHILPFIFLLSLIFNLVVCMIQNKYILISLEIITYILTININLLLSNKKNYKYLILSDIIFPILHISYGNGTLSSIIKNYKGN
jgi:glycosyltransferase involved in cell wall biosynthesis